MSITKKTINDTEFEFVNNFRGNRSGFVHETKLYRNGRLIGENKIQYYNRTWESYDYQSVMKGLVYALIEECEEAYKNAWKNDHGIKRLTNAKKDEMWKELMANPPANHKEFIELYTML